MGFTKRRAKECEEKCVDLLSRVWGGSFATHPDQYHVYDIDGTAEDGRIFHVEVKERRQLWDTMFLEEDKVERLLEEADKQGADKCILVNYIAGVAYFYDVEEIANSPVIEKAMNRTTAKGFRDSGRKVVKRVHEFNADTTIAILNTNKDE